MLRVDIPESVTVIEHYDERGVVCALGNGFFVSVAKQLYLVTARHVLETAVHTWQVTDNESRTAEPKVVIKLRSKRDNSFYDRSVDLMKDNAPTWLACTERRIDVAVVPLNGAEFSDFRLQPWSDSEFLSSVSSLETDQEVFVFSHPANYGPQPQPYDFAAEYKYCENGDTGVIDRGLCPGNSGSLVYRFENVTSSESESNSTVQLIGVFCGALAQNPAAGYFLDTKVLSSIIEGDEDCFDKAQAAFDDIMEEVSIRFRGRRSSTS